MENPKARPSPEQKEVVALHLDLCNFTGISQQLEPMERTRSIHEIFCEFDEHLMLHGLFKVDTIGGAYVAVGFVHSASTEDSFNTCQAMMHVTSLMLTTLVQYRRRRGIELSCRIGISRGTVYAGVLGVLQVSCIPRTALGMPNRRCPLSRHVLELNVPIVLAQPRYQLLGKPMRVAEELESNSIVDGVHVSEEV